MFRKAIIIGVGQIGASLGMNLVAGKLASEVVGIGRDPKNLGTAIRRRAIHRGFRGETRGLAPVLAGLSPDDLIVLATPVRTVRDLLRKMPKGPLILDVGSTKAAIVREASKRRLRFVGCHPIAGTEVAGAAGADRDLFRGKVCLVTPPASAASRDIALARNLWRRVGARVSVMDPKDHDRLLAAFSHLPHVLAYGLMAWAPVASVPKGLFAGLGSFRSATRVAASSAEMWRDILLENRDAVLQAVSGLVREFQRMTRLIARRDAGGLLRYLERSRKKRRGLP